MTVKCILCQVRWAGHGELCCECREVAFPGRVPVVMPQPGMAPTVVAAATDRVRQTVKQTRQLTKAAHASASEVAERMHGEVMADDLDHVPVP